MRAFACLYLAFVGRIGQLGEVGVQHVARQVGIPLGMREECGDADFGRVVLRLACTPECASVLHHPVGREQQEKVRSPVFNVRLQLRLAVLEWRLLVRRNALLGHCQQHSDRHV